MLALPGASLLNSLPNRPAGAQGTASVAALQHATVRGPCCKILSWLACHRNGGQCINIYSKSKTDA